VYDGPAVRLLEDEEAARRWGGLLQRNVEAVQVDDHGRAGTPQMGAHVGTRETYRLRRARRRHEVGREEGEPARAQVGDPADEEQSGIGSEVVIDVERKCRSEKKLSRWNRL
jgi:hypothetical protein